MNTLKNNIWRILMNKSILFISALLLAHTQLFGMGCEKSLAATQDVVQVFTPEIFNSNLFSSRGTLNVFEISDAKKIFEIHEQRALNEPTRENVLNSLITLSIIYLKRPVTEDIKPLREREKKLLNLVLKNCSLKKTKEKIGNDKLSAIMNDTCGLFKFLYNDYLLYQKIANDGPDTIVPDEVTKTIPGFINKNEKRIAAIKQIPSLENKKALIKTIKQYNEVFSTRHWLESYFHDSLPGIQKLNTENKRLQSDNDKLNNENKQLTVDNEKLTKEKRLLTIATTLLCVLNDQESSENNAEQDLV
jgi:hypothetical protein